MPTTPGAGTAAQLWTAGRGQGRQHKETILPPWYSNLLSASIPYPSVSIEIPIMGTTLL